MLDDVLLDIEPVTLSADGLEILDRLAARPEAAWYHRRRREALAAAGFVGAYNPMQPRGKDGKWIEVFGWIRWLSAYGKWRRGQVKGWSPKDGSVLIKGDDGQNLVFSKQEIADRVYSLTTPKATMTLPKPGAHGVADTDAPGFFKIGGQGGSNPGGMYQVTDPAAVQADSPVTPEMTRAALDFGGHGSKLQPLIAPVINDDLATWMSAEPQLKTDNALILDGSTNRTFSKIGGTYWDLGTNEPVNPEQIFGEKNSPRRSEIVGKLDIVSETDDLTFSDFANLLTTARSMAGPKPGKDDKLYVKTTKSPEHAKNEALANYLYELGGVPVPETSVGSDGFTFASKIVAGDDVRELSEFFTAPGMVNSEGFDVLDKLREDYVFDAWLANWDVVGMNYDNVKVVDGVPYRIDAGGALEYRAMGNPKGQAFGTDVGELESLINPSINPQATNVFAGIDNLQILKGVDRLAAIAPQDIINAVEAHGLDKSMSDKLIARRKFILDKFGVEEPPVDVESMPSLPPVLPPPDLLPPLVMSPVESDTPTPKVFPSDISGMYWNADAGNFLPGISPPDSAVNTYNVYLSLFSDKKMSVVADGYAGGNEVRLVLNDSVWRVDDFASPSPNSYVWNLTHVVTGEKTTLVSGPDLSAPAEVRSVEDMEALDDSYRMRFNEFRNHTANRFTTVQEVLSAPADYPALETRAVNATTIGEIQPGDWVINTVDPAKPVAYKIEKIDLPATTPENGYAPSQTWINAIDMNGDKVGVKANWFMRIGKPGTVLDETLDAIQARNIVAKTGDTNDDNAPTVIDVQNTMTPSDTVMQKISASQTEMTPIPPPGYTYNQATGTYDPVTSETAEPEIPVPEELEWFDPETQINKNLNVIGDPIHVPDLDINSVKPLIGKRVYFRYHMKTGQVRERGVFELIGAKEKHAGYPQYGLELEFRDMTGRIHRKDSKQTQFDHSGFGGEMFEVEGNIAGITQYTEKQDGTIVVNGEVVGSWVKNAPASYWDKPTWTGTISGKYTVSGKEFTTVDLRKKGSVKTTVIPLLMPPGSGGSKPKTAKVKEIQKQIVLQQIAFGSKIKETTAAGKAVTLMDGAEVKLGMWTISKTDGKIGKIVATEVSPEAGVTGSVKVEYDDPSSPGKKMVKIRGASTLSAAVGPGGEVPPGSPLFAKVKLSDGSQPFASQEVMDDTGAAVIIMGIKPDGNVRVMNLIDGTKRWTKAAKLTPSKDYSQEVIVEVDADPAGVVAMSTPSWKTTSKAKKIPYAAPGGAVISQPSNAVAEYRKFAPERKLTKDNFVPRIGMRVRDSKGTQLVILRQNRTFDSNPSTVYVIDPTVGGKPKARQPSTLWVDHAAELSTWDGEPLPKVAKAHYNAGGDENYPDGSTLYSYPYVTVNYEGKRTKLIRFILVQPDGVVRYVNAGGAKNTVSAWELQNILSQQGSYGLVSKVAYFDSTSTSTLTIENPGSAEISKTWVHDSAPGALEDLKEEIAKEALETKPLPGQLQSDVEPEVFGGDKGTLVDLPKPTNAPDTNVGTAGPTPPPIQSDPARLRQPAAVIGGFSIGSGIDELQKRIATGAPGSRAMYSMGDSDYIEDMAIRLTSAVDKQTGQEYVEVRFRLLEDKTDNLGTRLITNQGQAKTGGWNKTPLKTPKDIIVGDAISVRISSTVPEPNGGALKPDVAENPNATVVGAPVLVGTTKNGLEAYRIDVVTAGGAVGSLIVENRATPSVPTYEWDPHKIIPSSYFDSTLNPAAVAMGWTIRNNNSSGYETTTGVGEPDAQGRKVINPEGKSVRTTGTAPEGAYRLKYNGGDGSYMTVQVTHPAAEKRQPNLFKGKQPSKSRSIRHTVNGEVLIRVPAGDPNALDKISSMMSAVGVPPSAQGQPTGRELRKMALNKVFKQFNLTYEHLQRPDVTGDNDASAQAVLSLLDAQVHQWMPGERNVTMDDIELRVAPNGRMEVILSDDVAHALNQKANFKFAYHGLTRGYQPLIWTSKAETGLMSTDERWSAGIVVDGGSSEDDVTHDAGNRIFFRFSEGTNLHGDIILSPTAVNKKLDNYWSPNDYWGRRHPENTAKQYLQATQFQSDNEVKIKRMIDPEMMAFVLVADGTLQQRIDELKKAGVTHINGRPVEEIWRAKSSTGVTANDLDDLGAHYGNEIPITAIPLEGVPVAAGGGTMTGNIILTSSSDPRLS